MTILHKSTRAGQTKFALALLLVTLLGLGFIYEVIQFSLWLIHP